MKEPQGDRPDISSNIGHPSKDVPLYLDPTPWWEQEYWRTRVEQDKLQEKVEFSDGEHTISIYNFDEPLREEQIGEVSEALSVLASISNGEALRVYDDILLTEEQPPDVPGLGPPNGYGMLTSRHIVLYPNALRPIHHRVTNKVSNLQGTLVHEGTHNALVEKVADEWRQLGGWTTLVDAKKGSPEGTTKQYATSDPERCVTAYATANYDEDLCESNVARVYDPDKLDKGKLKFVQEKLPINTTIKREWKVTRIPAANVQIPTTQ